ncbi:hypothetical protein X777_06604 [Ooceraea biroi]|uniref:Uncharacterized protein n=1 Tax=Ooceraea biroi TaxID=2015173 RepID=A0A026WDZ2_OOCBI|nr:hypothetical protein X777_06604 [Ooceraea biroi]
MECSLRMCENRVPLTTVDNTAQGELSMKNVKVLCCARDRRPDYAAVSLDKELEEKDSRNEKRYKREQIFGVKIELERERERTKLERSDSSEELSDSDEIEK